MIIENLGLIELGLIGLGFVIILCILFKYYWPLIYYVVASFIILLVNYYYPESYPETIQGILTAIIILCPPVLIVWGFPVILILGIIGDLIEMLEDWEKEFPTVAKSLIKFGFANMIKVIPIAALLASSVIYFELNPISTIENYQIAIIINVVVWYIGGYLLSKLVNKGRIEKFWKYRIKEDNSEYRLRTYGEITSEGIDKLIDEADNEITRGNFEGYFMKGKILFDFRDFDKAQKQFNKLIDNILDKNSISNHDKLLLEKSFGHLAYIHESYRAYEASIEARTKALDYSTTSQRKSDNKRTLKKLKAFYRPSYNLKTALLGL